MKRNENTTKPYSRALFTALLLLVFVSFALSSAAETAALTVGETAYVRMKEYSAAPMKDTTPAGDESKLPFGEAVKLIQKKEGVPTFWLVAKGQTQAWIPAYALTVNKAEIGFLKDKSRIPETMTFIYIKDGVLKVWGIFNNGIFVIDSQGMALQDYAEGTSPVAFKGNTVVFDEAAAKETWKKPIVFTEAKKPFQLTPTCLYYCVSEGDKPAFECIDLVELKIRK